MTLPYRAYTELRGKLVNLFIITGIKVLCHPEIVRNTIF